MSTTLLSGGGSVPDYLLAPASGLPGDPLPDGTPPWPFNYDVLTLDVQQYIYDGTLTRPIVATATTLVGDGSGLTGVGVLPTGPAGGDLGGTYPSPTVVSGAHLGAGTVPYSAITGGPSSLPPAGAAGGDLGGNYPNPTVVGGTHLIGVPYTSLTGAPSSLPPNGSAGGDLGGTYPNPTVVNGAHLGAGTVPYSAISGGPSSLPPSGAAGGDLGGTYPNPTVTSGAHLGANSVPNTSLQNAVAVSGSLTAPDHQIVLSGSAPATNSNVQLWANYGNANLLQILFPSGHATWFSDTGIIYNNGNYLTQTNQGNGAGAGNVFLDAGSTSTSNGGAISTYGAGARSTLENGSGAGGNIDTSGKGNYNGGSVLTHATLGSNSGGSIDTTAGGSIKMAAGDIFFGTGAPSTSAHPAGSYYFQTDSAGLWFYNGSTWVPAAVSISYQQFTSAGVTTYTPNPRLIFAEVEVLGGGGSSPATNSSQYSSGGGGGGYGKAIVQAATIGASLSVTVGGSNQTTYFGPSGSPVVYASPGGQGTAGSVGVQIAGGNGGSVIGASAIILVYGDDGGMTYGPSNIGYGGGNPFAPMRAPLSTSSGRSYGGGAAGQNPSSVAVNGGTGGIFIKEFCF